MKQKKKIQVTQSVASYSERLATTLADISDSKKMYEFLQSFLSKSELLQLSTRLAIYSELKAGKSYEQIQGELGVSSATISTASAQQKQPAIQMAMKLLDIDAWAKTTASKLRRLLPFL